MPQARESARGLLVAHFVRLVGNGRNGGHDSERSVPAVPGGQLAHFASANDQDTATLERTQGLTGKIGGDGADRGCVAIDVGLRAGTLPDANGAAEGGVKTRTDGAGLASDLERLPHLA